MRRLGRTTLVCGLAALILAAGGGTAHALNPFNFGNPEFCEPKEPLRDFGLSRLPPVRELPSEQGGLPFAPPSVDFYGSFLTGRILTGQGSFGLGFSESNYRGTVRLDWTVTAQMWLLGGKGAPMREVGSTSLLIGNLDSADQPNISLETGARRGFYRFDIQFADKNGAQLGSYSTYLKVAKPFWKARLGIDRRAYRPGQLVLSRPENRGTEWMSYGEDFAVQRWRNGDWEQAPELTPDAWLLWLGYGGPGSAGRCSAIRLPRDATPGRYRIVKRVAREGSSRRGRSYNLTAPFRVTRPT